MSSVPCGIGKREDDIDYLNLRCNVLSAMTQRRSRYSVSQRLPEPCGSRGGRVALPLASDSRATQRNASHAARCLRNDNALVSAYIRGRRTVSKRTVTASFPSDAFTLMAPLMALETLNSSGFLRP